MATEEELVNLNEKVYAVDPNHKQDGQPVKVLKKGDEIRTEDGQRFKVISVKNGDKSFQGMAVAPIENGQPDYNQVTVVAAGTDPSDWTDLWGAFNGGMPNGSPQAEVAIDYVGALISEHPNWKITQLSGYSQSAYMLKAGAHYKIPTTVFSGWFQYSSLTKDEEDFMKANPHLFTNYRQKNDPTTRWNDFNAKWGNSDDFGTIAWITGDSHDLTSWKFDDKTGQIKISDSEENYEGAMIQKGHFIMQGFLTQLSKLEQLKSKLVASGGGLSKNEKIYLNNQQALLAVETGQAAYQNAIENTIKVYRKAITEAEDIWQETLRDSRAQIEELSNNEIIDNLAIVGATEQSIVREPTEYFNQKINNVKMMEEKFKSLSKEIKNSIDELVQKDQQLAQQLKF